MDLLYKLISDTKKLKEFYSLDYLESLIQKLFEKEDANFEKILLDINKLEN